MAISNSKIIKYYDIENILHPLYVVYVSTRYAYCIKLAEVCKKRANICGRPGLRVLCSFILYYAFLILSNQMVSEYIFTFWLINSMWKKNEITTKYKIKYSYLNILHRNLTLGIKKLMWTKNSGFLSCQLHCALRD